MPHELLHLRDERRRQQRAQRGRRVVRHVKSDLIGGRRVEESALAQPKRPTSKGRGPQYAYRAELRSRARWRAERSECQCMQSGERRVMMASRERGGSASARAHQRWIILRLVGRDARPELPAGEKAADRAVSHVDDE